MGESQIQQHILQNLTTSVALLEKHAEHTNTRFDTIGEKLERLVERLEALTLSNMKLLTMHDERIKDLIRDVNRLETDTEKAIDTQSTRVSLLETSLTARLTKLEQWRLMMVGVGMAVGALLTYIPSLLAMLRNIFTLP